MNMAYLQYSLMEIAPSGEILLPMLSRILILLFALSGSASAQINPDWTQPFPPHRVIGNVYYVGSKDLASYLITTPQGHILINSSLTSSPALIRKSVE
jgi:metallo-beta-lactamase class B